MTKKVVDCTTAAVEGFRAIVDAGSIRIGFREKACLCPRACPPLYAPLQRREKRYEQSLAG
jgi:hypothetical protein